MNMMMFGMTSLQMVVLTFNENNDLLIKEIEQGLYSPLAYFINISLVNLPWNLLMYMFMAIPPYFITGYNLHSYMNLVNYCLIVIATYVVGECYGTFVSIISGSAERAVAISPIVTQPMVMFAGFFLNDNSVAIWLSEFKYISYFRYIYLA